MLRSLVRLGVWANSRPLLAWVTLLNILLFSAIDVSGSFEFRSEQAEKVVQLVYGRNLWQSVQIPLLFKVRRKTSTSCVLGVNLTCMNADFCRHAHKTAGSDNQPASRVFRLLHREFMEKRFIKLLLKCLLSTHRTKRRNSGWDQMRTEADIHPWWAWDSFYLCLIKHMCIVKKICQKICSILRNGLY